MSDITPEKEKEKLPSKTGESTNNESVGEPIIKETQSPDGNTEVIIDTSGVVEKLEGKIPMMVESAVAKIMDARGLETNSEDGKGSNTVSEELKALESIAERLRDNPVKEQWMVVLPGQTTKELTGHLRDFCQTTTITKGQPGDEVNIPYVNDFDFEILSAVGDAFSDSLGTVYGTTVTTLKEAGGWTRIPYKDIEKITGNLLAQINQAFVRAALRAEDRIILEDLDGNTTNQLAGAIDRDTESTETGKISAVDIPKAIGKLLTAGKSVEPGECVAYLTGGAYAGLLEDMADSQPFAFTNPQYLQTGKITELMGVKLVTGHTWAIGPPRGGATGTGYCCFVGRWKRGVVLAPKRELLLETEKFTRTRTQTLTGSHTIGLKILDPKEFCRINTSQQV